MRWWPTRSKPPEFDLSLAEAAAWVGSGPEGIGETAIGPDGKDELEIEGDDPATALRQTLGMFATGVTVITDGGRRSDPRHDRKRVHVGLAGAAPGADLGRPPHQDVQPPARGPALRGKRAGGGPGRALRPLRRPSGEGTPSRRSRSCTRRRWWTAPPPSSYPRSRSPTGAATCSSSSAASNTPATTTAPSPSSSTAASTEASAPAPNGLAQRRPPLAQGGVGAGSSALQLQFQEWFPDVARVETAPDDDPSRGRSFFGS